MPASRQARITRTAISPRLAIRTFFSGVVSGTAPQYRPGSAGQTGLQRDLHAGQGLAHGAPCLGLLRGLLERRLVDAVDLALDRELDPREHETTRRVFPEGHVGGDVERLRRATGLGHDVGALHRAARGVGCRDQLLGARRTVGVVGRTLGERDLEGVESRAGQLDLAGPVLQAAVPGGACGTCGHGASSWSRRGPVPARTRTYTYRQR